MSSNETAAYEIMRSLNVDYVLVIFGGVIGYSGDDINKFLWMVRIAEGEHPKDIKVSSFASTVERVSTHKMAVTPCKIFLFLSCMQVPFQSLMLPLIGTVKKARSLFSFTNAFDSTLYSF